MLTVLALLFLLLLIVYLFKKKNKLEFGGNTNIKIIDRKYLGQKQYLATIIVDDEKLLLGITDQSINLIKTLENDEPLEDEETHQNFSKQQSETFPKILGNLRKNR